MRSAIASGIVRGEAPVYFVPCSQKQSQTFLQKFSQPSFFFVFKDGEHSSYRRELQILRGGRLRVRDFLNTEQCSRVKPASFWQENVIVVVILLGQVCDRERAKPSLKMITLLIFQMKNSAMKLSGLKTCREYAKNPLSYIPHSYSFSNLKLCNTLICV